MEHTILDIQTLKGLTTVHNVVFWISTALLPTELGGPRMFIVVNISCSVSICVARHSILSSLLIDPSTGGCL